MNELTRAFDVGGSCDVSKMPSNDHNYVMSPETAETVGGLLNGFGDTNEVQPTQLANRGQSRGVSGALSTKRQARQDQVTTMCCENRACKKARLMQKNGGLHLRAFFCYVCLLISCIYAHMLCLLACCFNGVSLRLLSHGSATSISYLLVLWSADRTVYLQIESETGDREGAILPGCVIADVMGGYVY